MASTGTGVSVEVVCVTIDNTAPTADDLEDTTYYEGDTVTISITGYDNIEIKSLCGQFDGEGYSCDDSGSGTEYTWSTIMGEVDFTEEDLEEGEYTFEYYVVDSAGNESETYTFTMTLANLPPEVDVTPDTSTIETGETVTLTANVTSGNTPYTYAWNCSNGDTFGDVDTIDFSETDTGTYLCMANVTDNDGDSDTDVVEILVVAPGVEGGDNVDLFGTGGGVIAPNVEVGNEAPEEEPAEDEEVADSDEGEVLGEGVQACEIKYRISGYAFEDKNKDGEKDNNEEVFGEVEIMIYEGKEIEEGEEPVLTTRTDENGYWEVMACPGDYTVKVNGDTAPENYQVPEARVLGVTDDGVNDVNWGFVKARGILSYWWILLIILVLLLVATYIRNRMKKKAV
jgi:hypothetical protein